MKTADDYRAEYVQLATRYCETHPGFTWQHIAHKLAPQNLEICLRAAPERLDFQALEDGPLKGLYLATETNARQYVRLARALVSDTPEPTDADWRAAASHLLRNRPDLCLDVLEQIGTWPSSEPGLRALQAMQGRRG